MKNSSFSIIIIWFILFFVTGCTDNKEKDASKNVQELEEFSNKNIFGNYVSSDYNKRNEGYDWISVNVTQKSLNSIGIKIRSRADKKKPTCTFDAIAYLSSNNEYKALEQGKTILINFDNNSLRITPEKESDIGLFDFYCSGGGSFVGSYTKINETLDRSQIDPTIFSKYLELQGISFYISSIERDNATLLTVTPSGLEIVNRPETTKVYGIVTEAEVEDMNADGSPEVLVYVHSKGSGTYGDVIAYSVNNRKSMSRIYFQPVTENDEINPGYMGHDQFSLVENYLVQRFPIYKKTDTNANPTGGIRQITYKLVDGEASRRFEVKSVVEFQ